MTNITYYNNTPRYTEDLFSAQGDIKTLIAETNVLPLSHSTNKPVAILSTHTNPNSANEQTEDSVVNVCKENGWLPKDENHPDYNTILHTVIPQKQRIFKYTFIVELSDQSVANMVIGSNLNDPSRREPDHPHYLDWKNATTQTAETFTLTESIYDGISVVIREGTVLSAPENVTVSIDDSYSHTTTSHATVAIVEDEIKITVDSSALFVIENGVAQDYTDIQATHSYLSFRATRREAQRLGGLEALADSGMLTDPNAMAFYMSITTQFNNLGWTGLPLTSRSPVSSGISQKFEPGTLFQAWQGDGSHIGTNWTEEDSLLDYGVLHMPETLDLFDEN